MRSLLSSELFLCCAVGLFAADSSAKLSLSQLPPAVQQAAKCQLAGAAVSDIKKADEAGEVSYTITGKTAKGERYFVVAENGTLTGVEVSLEETPPAVQKVIRTQVADGTIDGIEKNSEGSELSFDVDFTRKDGKERAVSVNAAGRVTSLELGVEEVPEPVRKTIHDHVKSATIEAVYKIFETNEFYYEVNFEKDGNTRDMVIDQNGKPETLQVILKDLPAAAQKTINEKVGNGKIVRIDKSYTPNQGIQPFEVEAVKDGKTISFSVGPKGRFLGMD